MSWFRTALSISAPEPGSYYTVIDPVEFHEWRYSGTAPKGAIFTLELPPSDIFTEGKVIASALLSDEKLEKKSHGWQLKEDSHVQVMLRVGCIHSPQDMLDKYKRIQANFDRGLNNFKEDLATRLYINSQTEKPHLFRVAHWDNESVTLHNFGSVKDLIEAFAEIREALSQEVMDKTGRAHEMEEFRRYENCMTFINNSHLHVDASKMDRLLETSGIKSTQTKTITWKECFLEASHGAQLLDEALNEFNSKTWVQAVSAKNV